MDIRDYLKKHVLMLDGAMGTYYASFPQTREISCETANLLRPELIRQIHSEYLHAGSRGIITNTFGVNRHSYLGNDEQAEAVLEAGWRLANEAVSEFRSEHHDEEIFVFADIGPVSDQEISAASEYIWTAEHFLRLGARNFIFETNSSPEGIADACAYIKAAQPEAFIIVSFASQPDGYTASGYDIRQLLIRFHGMETVDLVGLNCLSSARHMLELVRQLKLEGIPLCLKPNAGYPIVLGTRTVYDSNPDYFAAVAACMPSEGAVMLGGCCGTTPDFIKRLHDSLEGGSVSRILPANAPASRSLTSSPVSPTAEPENTFITKLKSKEKPFAVELDPPENFDFSGFMSNTWLLKRKGADMITIADCPIARSRMDSTLLACKLRRELGMEVMPHMTSRDRNLNAAKALLMGSYAEGIRNILLVTGDPIPSAQRDEVKSVFQFNSRKMASYVHSLKGKLIPGSFNIFGALNVNARNFRVQLELAKEKEACGMIGFLTQPVLTRQGLENLMLARRELDAFILGGIMPIVSAANARYMDSEINGINVEQEIIDSYEELDRSAAEELAVKISTEIACRMKEYVDGYYIITPFNRAGLVGRIMDSIRERLSSSENPHEA